MLLFRKEFQNCRILFEVLFEMELHGCGFLTDTSVITSVGFYSLQWDGSPYHPQAY